MADRRLTLLESTYKEVLDATKHQDDKIGRMLTAIAFLTAASLALANLVSGTLLVVRFSVPPESIPLAAIALGSFLVLVIATVVLLVSSLSTPLRIPGLKPTPRPTPKESLVPYAKDVKASQIYFMPIARVSLEEWRHKWSASEQELEAELVPTYVDETHNLAVRTNFKYERTTEAVAVFSLALFAFGLAAVLVFIAAVSKDRPVELDWLQRTLLALYVGGFSFIELVTRARYDSQATEDALAIQWKLFLFAAPTALGLLVLPQGGSAARGIFAAVAVLTAVSFGCLWSLLERWTRLAVGIAFFALVSLAGWAFAADNYAGQFAIAVIGVTLTTLPSLLSATLDSNERRKKFLKRNEAAAS